MIKRLLFSYIVFFTLLVQAGAQERTVQNRPYTDLRTLHFGVLVGMHLQDLEFTNVGPQTITDENGNVQSVLITTDQDRWDPGFTVGVLGELRLSTYLQFRVAPAMYFGSRHVTFRNFTEIGANGNPTEYSQDIKTAYITSAFNLIMAAPRFNNHRPYIMVGVSPVINLNAKNDDYLKLSRFDTFLEAGIGCDFYLPYFKLRPELKFMYGLNNGIDKNHASNLRDASMIPYAQSVSKARNKIIALTFYFE